MARFSRIDLPGIPQLDIQRRNTRQFCFAADIDCGQYLQKLRAAALKRDCAAHAFVPMTNYIHLLIRPAALVPFLS